jgi:hypothetical protein
MIDTRLGRHGLPWRRINAAPEGFGVGLLLRPGGPHAGAASTRLLGHEIVVKREPAANHANEDLHVAIKDAFDVTRRGLQDYERELRGEAKAHMEPPP